MRDTPISRLLQCGQSVWLDSVSRGMLLSGELVALIQEEGVSGVGCGTACLEHSVAAGSDYDASIAALALKGLDTVPICETLLVEDARTAADLLRPLYDLSRTGEGFVTLELSPHLAHDASGVLLEARRLWDRVDRPNLFIKIVATLEGVAALRQLIAEGVNVAVEAVFSVERYRAVAEAYLDGLSQRAARGLPLERVASVVSCHLWQLDRVLEPILSRLARAGSASERVLAEALRGKSAIALAKALRAVNCEIHGNSRFLALAARGARAQKLLWVSSGTSTAFDTRHADALVGPDTVQVMSLSVLAAYQERGRPSRGLDAGLEDALVFLEQLGALGVDLEQLAQELEDEGVQRLARPYDSLLRNVELKRRKAVG